MSNSAQNFSTKHKNMGKNEGGQGLKENIENYPGDAIIKCFACQRCGSIYGPAVIIWTPAGTINLDMLWVQAQGLSLNRIRHVTIQHTNTWNIYQSIKIENKKKKNQQAFDTIDGILV